MVGLLGVLRYFVSIICYSRAVEALLYLWGGILL